MRAARRTVRKHRWKQLRDKMVGVFVTFEPLELDYDIESLLQDDHAALHGEGVTVGDPKYLKYAEKLPATVTDEGWVVSGHEGLTFGVQLREDHSATVSGEGVSELRTDWTVGDDGETVKMEGTICFPEGADVTICTNPVYMTETGNRIPTPQNSLPPPGA